MLRQPMMFSKRGTSASDVDARIAANVGLGQLPYFQTWQPVGASYGTLTANTLHLMRFRLDVPLVVNKATIGVGTASGNVDVFVYQSDGTTLTRLVSSGSTPVAGTNTTQPLTLTQTTLPAGVDLNVGLGVDNGTATILRMTYGFTGGAAAAAVANQLMSKAASFPAPATLTVASLAGISLIPWIVLTGPAT